MVKSQEAIAYTQCQTALFGANGRLRRATQRSRDIAAARQQAEVKHSKTLGN
jgi:hypothetical protein